MAASEEIIKRIAAEVMRVPAGTEQDHRLRQAFEYLADADWPALIRECWRLKNRPIPGGAAPASKSEPF